MGNKFSGWLRRLTAAVMALVLAAAFLGGIAAVAQRGEQNGLFSSGPLFETGEAAGHFELRLFGGSCLLRIRIPDFLRGQSFEKQLF